MTLENLANLANIVGVVVIIASLFYVARELRQNTEMMRAESRNQISNNHQHETHALIEYPDIVSGLLETDLDDRVVRLHAWLSGLCRAREHEWLQLCNGALDQSAWESYSSTVPLVLGGRKARAWWNVMKPAFDESFVEQVEQMLEKSPLSRVNMQIGQALSEALSGNAALDQKA